MPLQAHKDQNGKIILPPDYFVFVKGGTLKLLGEGPMIGQLIQNLRISDFYIARYPLTQTIYETVMGENPSHFKGRERPVELVSWLEAIEFCKKLSSQTNHSYRLPTEVEWEYAAQGGNLLRQKKPIYAGSNNLYEVGWYEENSHGETKPVGLLKPNQLGIYDMCGNVWEWCSSLYQPYPYYAKDGRENLKDEGDHRVCRGGSWSLIAPSCRLANRSGTAPAHGYDNLGFRLALASV